MGNRSVRGKPLPTLNYPDSSVSIERNVDDDELDDFDEDYDVRISTDYIDSLVSDLCTLSQFREKNFTKEEQDFCDFQPVK